MSSISRSIWPIRSVIAFGLPNPSTSVVSSLVTVTRRTRPSTSRPIWSSLSPTSGATTWPPDTIARSSRNALRRSPKNGAFTATAGNVLRMALTTRVDSASPSTSSAMISSGLDSWMTFSSSGSRSDRLLIFCPVMSTYGSSKTASMLSWSVTK